MRKPAIKNIFFLLAVLLLVAKPFLGFAMFSRIHPPASSNIFVKAFTKRKQEYTRNSSFDMAAVQKKLADPIQPFLLISFLLSLIFPFVFKKGSTINDSLIHRIKQKLASGRFSWLLNSALLI